MVRLVLLGVLLPLAACAAILAAAWRPWRADAGPGAWRCAGAVAFGAAFVLAGIPAEGWSGLPPRDQWQWIMELGAAAAIIGAAEALGWIRGANWPLRVFLAGASALLLVGTWVPGYWAWRGGAAALILGLLAALGASAQRPGGSPPMALCVAYLGGSVILLAAQSVKLAQMAGAMAACLGAATVLCWWRPRIAPLAGAIPLLAVALPGLLLSGKFLTFSEVPAWSFVLAAASPAGLLVGDIPPFNGSRPRAVATLRVVCVLDAVAIAVAAAV